MTFKKTLLSIGLLTMVTGAMAATPNLTQQASNRVGHAANHETTELAANVITAKRATIDTKITRNGSTEVFMDLANSGKEMHEIVAAISPIADQVQLHMTIKNNGRTTMQQIHDITIPAHAKKDLQLGGMHIMLIGLKKHLIKNNRVPVTLVFNDGSWETIDAIITSKRRA